MVPQGTRESVHHWHGLFARHAHITREDRPVRSYECDMQDLSVREDPGKAAIEDLAARSRRTAGSEVGDGEVAVDEAPDCGCVDTHRRVEQS